MKQQSIYGIALIVGSLAGVVTMIFHTSGLSHMRHLINWGIWLK